MDRFKIVERLEALAHLPTGDVGIRDDGRFRIPAKGKQAAERVTQHINSVFSSEGRPPLAEASGPNVLLEIREDAEAKLHILALAVDFDDLRIKDSVPELRGVGQQVDLDRAETRRRIGISESVGDLLRRGQVFLLSESEYGVEVASNYAAREMAALINGKAEMPFASVRDNMLVLEMETDTSDRLMLIDDLKGHLLLKARLQTGDEPLAKEIAEERNAAENAHQNELREARRILKEGVGDKGRGR